MNSTVRLAIAAAVGVSLTGWAAWERQAGQRAQGRFAEVVIQQQVLKKRYAKAIAEHAELTAGLASEKQHSQELSQALNDARAKMQEALARLTEESRSVKELQGRLTAMQQRMDQLQGELSIALDSNASGPSAGKDAVPIELDRIVVGQAGAQPLQGRVISVHPDWNFVVVSLGWDAVKIGEQISIMREDQVMAKARVERIQEGVCAATVLPDSQIGNINVNDTARVL